MNALFLALAVICFIAQAFGHLININCQWWALGVAFYLASKFPTNRTEP